MATHIDRTGNKAEFSLPLSDLVARCAPNPIHWLELDVAHLLGTNYGCARLPDGRVILTEEDSGDEEVAPGGQVLLNEHESSLVETGEEGDSRVRSYLHEKCARAVTADSTI